MALSDNPEINPVPEYQRRGCTLGQWARTLPPADLAVLKSWLEDESTTGSAIAARINADPDYSVQMSGRTVARHRAGGCTCGSL